VRDCESRLAPFISFIRFIFQIHVRRSRFLRFLDESVQRHDSAFIV
jgi:hypothetical protein